MLKFELSSFVGWWAGIMFLRSCQERRAIRPNFDRMEDDFVQMLISHPLTNPSLDCRQNQCSCNGTSRNSSLLYIYLATGLIELVSAHWLIASLWQTSSLQAFKLLHFFALFVALFSHSHHPSLSNSESALLVCAKNERGGMRDTVLSLFPHCCD